MITIYELPNYCTDLEIAKLNNTSLMKKKIELGNKLRKTKGKKKSNKGRKKLITKYHSIKSLTFGLMYGRSVIPSMATIDEVNVPSPINKDLNSLLKKYDVPSNLYFNISKAEKDYDIFLQGMYKEKSYNLKCYNALKEAGLVERSIDSAIIIKQENIEKAKQIIKNVTLKHS